MLPGSSMAFAVIEIKVADPICGIGQLFAYRAGLNGNPHLVLVVSQGAFSSRVRYACLEAGIECWTVRGDFNDVTFRHAVGPKNLWNKFRGGEPLENT